MERPPVFYFSGNFRLRTSAYFSTRNGMAPPFFI